MVSTTRARAPIPPVEGVPATTQPEASEPVKKKPKKNSGKRGNKQKPANTLAQKDMPPTASPPPATTSPEFVAAQTMRPPLAPLALQGQITQTQTARPQPQAAVPRPQAAASREPEQLENQSGGQAVIDKDAKIAELLAQVALLTAAQQGQASNAQGIVELSKPKGEAGGGKRGFVLRDAMGLGSDQNAAVYRRIQNSVRRNIYRYDIDPMVRFHDQPPHKLATVLQAGRQQHSYLCTARFPSDWAQMELIKTIIRNRRKYVRRITGQEDDDSDADEDASLPNFDELETTN